MGAGRGRPVGGGPVADPGGGDRDDPPLAILNPPPWNVDDVTRALSKGVVLVNVQEWGCFSIFRRADDVTRTMSKGGGVLVNVSPPPLQEILYPRLGPMNCAAGARPGSRRH